MKYLFLCLILCPSLLYSQDSIQVFPIKYSDAVLKKTESISSKLLSRTDKSIQSFKRQERKIYKKLLRLDSARAASFLQESEKRYTELQEAMTEGKTPGYLGSIDTMKTALAYLEKNIPTNIGEEEKRKISAAAASIGGLKNSIGASDIVKQFLQKRKEQIKSELGDLPISSELKKLNKEAYYYSAQLKEYKALLSDKRKIEKKALDVLIKSKPFKDFLKKNSELSKYFRLNTNESPIDPTSVSGLQTRAQVNNLLQQRISPGTEGNLQVFQTNIGAAQNQLTELKNKMQMHRSGGSSEELPDGFKPNTQRVKSFWKRLEYGTDFQHTKAKSLFPTTIDVGGFVGYKLNDKSLIGFGGSYKMGLGRGWDDFEISNQGYAFRSFIDYRLKGSISIAGGYGFAFNNEINRNSTLQGFQSWSRQGLIGVSKKYSVSKKVAGQVSVLWDFLSYQQTPRNKPLVVRFGYSLK